MAKRPTFDELRAEADRFIGPPRPPKMKTRDPARIEAAARDWLEAHGVEIDEEMDDRLSELD